MALSLVDNAKTLADIGRSASVARLMIMSVRATSTILAIVAFLAIVGIAALGADRPPPPGFMVVVVLAAGYALGWLATSLVVPWTPWLLVGLAVLAILGAAFSGLVLVVGRLLATI